MKSFPPIALALGLVVGLSVGLVLTPLLFVERVQIAPWLEVVHRVCTSIGGIGTFVALIFVVQQFFLMQKSIIASMDAQLYGRLDSFNKFIVEHHKEYALLGQPFTRETSEEERPKLHHLCDLGFTFFEEIYKHHMRYQLLNTEDWEEWQQNMMHFFAKPYVRGYWQTVADRYAKSFQTFANGLVAHVGGTTPASKQARD